MTAAPVEHRASTRERGVVTSMFAVLALFLFACVALVAEGGRKLSNVSRAEDIAAEAARSAAATLALGSLADGSPSIDAGRAREQADKVVNPIDGAEIVTFTSSSQSVVVVIRLRGESWIPGFDIDGVGSHRAIALDPFASTP